MKANPKDYGWIDGAGADNTSAMQAACNSGANTILLPDGPINFGQLVVPPTVHAFLGEGEGATILNCIGDFTDYQPWVYFNANNGIEVAGFTVNQSKLAYVINHAFNFGSCVDGVIRDIRFDESGFFAVYMNGCVSLDVERVVVANHGNSAITAEGSQKITLWKCEVLQPGTGHSLAIGGGGDHDISKCFVNGAGPGSFGIALGASDSIVGENRVRANHREGINLQDGSRNSLLGNIVKCDPGHLDFAISIYAANAPVEANVLASNRTYNSGHAGIAFASTPYANAFCRYNSAVGNHVMSPAQAGAAIPIEARAGVLLYGPQTAGNEVKTTTVIDQAANMRYAVAEWDDGLGAPSYNNFIHNHAPIGAGLVAQSRKLAATTKVWDLP